MLAAFYDRVGPAREVLAIGERPRPEPGPGEVRVRLACSGVNPSDVKTRAGTRSRTLPFAEIIPQLPEAYRPLIESLVDENNSLLQRVQQRARQNHLVLSRSVELMQDFLNRHYRGTSRDRRRCHPRDVINHAIDLIRFERRPWELNEEVLHLAFESVFVHDEDE